FMGGTNPKHYRGDSVLGVLVNRLERRFGKVGVLVLGGLENNELTYRVQLHPIPDKYDGNRDCNSARFIGAVRQELRQIARELDPRQRLQGGR
ncbi:MAG: hypothetical protein EBV03_07910, partial [Proteobacteria bacterium]|nr:hypothetical protein [Pseudomonadota bacterium]